MKEISIVEFRQILSEVLEATEAEPVRITREQGEDLIVLSASAYQELLDAEFNMLRAAVAQI